MIIKLIQFCYIMLTNVCNQIVASKLADNYSLDILNKCLDKYISDLNFNKTINMLMSKKKRRNENFPSDISENIAKFAILSGTGLISEISR